MGVSLPQFSRRAADCGAPGRFLGERAGCAVFFGGVFAAIPRAPQTARGFGESVRRRRALGLFGIPPARGAKKGSAKNQRRSHHILPICCLLTKIPRLSRTSERFRVRRAWRLAPPRRALTDSLSAPAFRISRKYLRMFRKTGEIWLPSPPFLSYFDFIGMVGLWKTQLPSLARNPI